MKHFLLGHGLESLIKIFFIKRIFSKQVLHWWINLQQQHIDRSEDPYRRWKRMKIMLQLRFDSPLKPKKKRVVACGTKFIDTMQIVRSSWAYSIVGNECLDVTNQQYVTIK